MANRNFYLPIFATRTRPLADATEDLAILGTGDAPTIAGANVPVPDSGFAWLLGSCTAVTFLLMATFLFIKRRRQPNGGVVADG